MSALQQFAPPPPAAVSRVLASFNRDQLEGFIAVAIDLLDLADPDPDAEETGLEDSFMDHPADGPGCPVADSGSDQAWPEWTSLRKHQRRGPLASPGHEDDEDDDAAEEDDPAGQCDEDGANTWGHHVRLAMLNAGPGCPWSDPGICDSGLPV